VVLGAKTVTDITDTFRAIICREDKVNWCSLQRSTKLLNVSALLLFSRIYGNKSAIKIGDATSSKNMIKIVKTVKT